MGILCSLFGHRTDPRHDVPYGKLMYRRKDDTGMTHAAVMVKCFRCNVRYFVAYVHLRRRDEEET